MKKNITPALLTLALVGFANAAPPVPQPPQDAKVLYANIFKLKRELADARAEARQALAGNVGFRNALIAARKQVETLKKENKVLDDKVLAFEGAEIVAREVGDIKPTVVPTTDRSSDQFVHPKAKDVVKRRNTVVTRKQMQEAYVKAFDLNKDGQVGINETPNRKQRNEFLHNFQNDNYRQDEIPLAQRRNRK